VVGLTTILESAPGITMTANPGHEPVDVVVVALDEMSSRGVDLLRKVASDPGRPVVLIARNITAANLLVAVECRVVAIVPPRAVTDDRLVTAVHTAAAAGGVDLPGDLLDKLVSHTKQLHREVLEPGNLTASSSTSREIDVLRLTADDLDTVEIARALSYPERTVKNIVYTITSRLQLRNRSHAVAFAM
jgi:DNA-binding NarL/FixJ family response regulator